jgi:hypothetical protein
VWFFCVSGVPSQLVLLMIHTSGETSVCLAVRSAGTAMPTPGVHPYISDIFLSRICWYFVSTLSLIYAKQIGSKKVVSTISAYQKFRVVYLHFTSSEVHKNIHG